MKNNEMISSRRACPPIATVRRRQPRYVVSIVRMELVTGSVGSKRTSTCVLLQLSKPRHSHSANEERSTLETAEIKDFTWHDLRPAHIRLVADHEGRLAPVRGRIVGPPRAADGHAVRASVARTSVRLKSACWIRRRRLHPLRRRLGAPKGQEKGNVPRREITRRRKSSNFRRELAPQAGFEPATLRLTAGCSAVELLRNLGRTHCGASEDARQNYQ